MNNKKASNQRDGDFIDLEKSQYKSRSYLKFSLIIISLIVCLSFFIVLYEKVNFVHFSSWFKSDPKININENFDSTKQIIKEEKKLGNLKIIEQQIDILKDELKENNIKLDQYESTIQILNSKVDSFEAKQKTNIDFLYAEKYLILNDLFRIRNKFDNRENFYDEIDSLSLKFKDNVSLKSLFEYFKKIDVQTLIKKEYLFEKLSEKLEYYDLDTNTFINTKINKYSNEKIYFDSKESFLKYLKNLFDSTFKITKFDETLVKNNPDFPNQLHVIKSIKKAKEYLILDDLERSIKEVKDLNLQDFIIQQWIEDAEKLKNAIEKLKVLESNLLIKVGTNFDKDN